MEGVLGALAFLAIAACCGLPILLLGAARLFNRNNNRQAKISSAGQERMLEANGLARPTLDPSSKQGVRDVLITGGVFSDRPLSSAEIWIPSGLP